MSAEVLSAILQEAARGGELETGGILLGREMAPAAETRIDMAGGPGPLAARGPRSFSRDLGHAQQLAAEAWRESGALWVGDWHTHPDSEPVPSPVDLRSYAAHLADPELDFQRFVSIVVGCAHGVPQSIAAWLISDGRVEQAQLLVT